MNYVKRAIPVQGWQWDGSPMVSGLPLGVLHSVREVDDIERFTGQIGTREGNVTIRIGDWIVGPGPEGEYWPVGRDIFTKTYQPASEAFKFGEEEAQTLTLAIVQYIITAYNGTLSSEHYEAINSLVRKFASK